MKALLLPLLVGCGLSTIVVGFLLRARDRAAAMESLLDLARQGEGEFDEPEIMEQARAAADVSTVARGAVSLAGRLIAQIDAQGALATSLERARIPLRPGEYAVVGACASIVGGLLVGTI